MKLRQATCPYCEENLFIVKKNKLKDTILIQVIEIILTQLRSNNTINLEEYNNYNIVNSRINRNRTRRRRRNLTMKEIQGEKIIKKSVKENGIKTEER